MDMITHFITLLVILKVAEVKSADITVKVALVSQRSTTTDLLREHADKYFEAVIKTLGLSQNVHLEPTFIEVHLLNDTGWREVSKKLTTESFVAVLGSYSPSVESIVSTKDTYIPYFLVDDVFLDIKADGNIGEDSKFCLKRVGGRFAISFLPPVNYLVTPLLQYLGDQLIGKAGQTSKKKPKYVLILEDMGSYLQVREGMKHGKENMLHAVPVFIALTATHIEIREQLAMVRRLETKDIVLFCFKGDYIMKIIKQAEKIDLLTKFYRWYIIYPDIDAFYLNEEDQIKQENITYHQESNFTQGFNATRKVKKGFNNNNGTDSYGENNQTQRLSPKLATHGADVMGFQLIDRDVFTHYDLQKPTEPSTSIQLATLLDAMIPLAKAIGDKLHAGGGQLDITAKLIGDFIYKKFQPSKVNEGSLGKYGAFKPTVTTTDQNPPEWNYCRINVDITWKRFYLGSFGEVMKLRINEASEQYYLRQDKKSDWTSIASEVKPTEPQPSSYSGLGLFSNFPVIVRIQKESDPLVNCQMINKVDLTCYGILFDIFSALNTEMGGFVFTITDEPGNIGRLTDRSGWDGIMNYIKKGSAAFGLGGFGITRKRKKFVQFSETILPVTISMLYKPVKPELNMWQFLKPLSWRVWLSIFIVFITISVILFVQDVLDWKDASFPMRDSFYYTAGILFSGSTDSAPATIPNRVLCACFMFFCLVVFQSYTANMTAFLTNRGGLKNIKTLQALSTQTVIEYGVVDGTATQWMLKHSLRDPYLSLWTAIANNKSSRIFSSHSAALKRVQKGRFVLITETPFAAYHRGQHCDLVKIDEETSTLNYAIAVPLGASYLIDLNKAILKLKSRGMDNLTNFAINKRGGSCKTNDISEHGSKEPLTWEEMVGVFIMLGIGVGVSFLVAVAGQVMQKMGVIQRYRAYRAQRRQDKVKRNSTKTDVVELPETGGIVQPISVPHSMFHID